MRSLRVLLLLAVLLAPSSSHALDLRWKGGATNLDFSGARRCTLFVSNGNKNPLPSEWELLYVTGSPSSPALALRNEATLVTDTARVRTVVLPGNPIEAVGNEDNASLDYTGGGRPALGQYVLDISPATHARLQVVAFTPTSLDSTTFAVWRSGEVSVNGGLSAAYPPTIHRAFRSHESNFYRVKAVGAGLGAVTAASIVSPYNSWELPLKINAQSDSTLVASASVEGTIGSCLLKLSVGGLPLASYALGADTTSSVGPLDPLVSSIYMVPGGNIQPKDFAFFYDDADSVHIFYIRQDTLLEKHVSPDSTERDLGHAVASYSGGLSAWQQQPIVMGIRPGKFDSNHVWAPHIVKRDSTYYMFYTGVDVRGHQHLGVATSASLRGTNWTRYNWPIYDSYNVPWAYKDTTTADGKQFRDPFVLSAPDSAGHWLMYYVTEPASAPRTYVVGLARSIGTSLFQWRDAGHLYSTNYASTFDSIEESPHLFWSHNAWRMMYTSNAGHAIQIEEHHFGDSLTAPEDTTYAFAGWHGRNRLYSYLLTTDPSTVNGWEATEFLKVGVNEYLGAYVGMAIAINELQWRATTPDSFTLIYPATAGVDWHQWIRAPGVLLRVVGLRPGIPRAQLRLELPGRQHARLVIYDVAGRQVRTLLDGELPAGTTTVTWDGRRGDGSPGSSGMYFARLTAASATAVARVPLIR